ncbi:MAG: phage recombination protein Bet [Pseudomonadota bacterium]
MNQAVATQVREARLPYIKGIEERFNIDRTSWRALVESIYPNATSSESVILALSYCRARNLDPFKRPIHIVPIWDKNQKRMVDTVWPGIAELRMTAHRTNEYAGKTPTAYGPDVTQTFTTAKNESFDVTYPEWAQVTVHRKLGDDIISFAGPRVYWIETYASNKDKTPNAMWRDRPRGQLDKCAEAAALRTAFPEELGSEYTADEAFASNARPAGGILEGERAVASDSTANTQSLDALSASMDDIDPVTGEVSASAKGTAARTAQQPNSPESANHTTPSQANASGAAAVTGEPSERGLPIDTPDDSPAPDAPQIGFERILRDIREAPYGSAAEDVHRKHSDWINLQATDDQKRQLNDAIEAHYAT